MLHQVGKHLIVLRVDHCRAYRHHQHNILSRLTRTLPAFAWAPISRTVNPLVAVINQSIEVMISLKPNTAAMATITTIRAAKFDKFFATKAEAPATTFTCMNANKRLIIKLHRYVPLGSRYN